MNGLAATGTAVRFRGNGLEAAGAAFGIQVLKDRLDGI
jgi:hypothetical protein